MRGIDRGVYPTMITPFTDDNKIDLQAVDALVKWYWRCGCSGIFAVCQSSEMFYLSLKEQLQLAHATIKAARGSQMSIVVSGHTAQSLEEQAEELIAMYETGADSVVLVTNRLDLHNDGDSEWLCNAERLISKLPADMKLGLYECPYPYKRLLTTEILRWCMNTGRFTFIKDTCCNITLLDERLSLLSDSKISLYNANSQTLLYALKKGAAGFSGVMANFHPELYVWMCDNYQKKPWVAELLQGYLSMFAMTEYLHYPVTAKYHCNCMDIPMSLYSRSVDPKGLNAYEKHVINQCIETERFVKMLLENERENTQAALNERLQMGEGGT